VRILRHSLRVTRGVGVSTANSTGEKYALKSGPAYSLQSLFRGYGLGIRG
jgi:hypothetical protein